MAKYLTRNNLSKGRVYFNSVGQDTDHHGGEARWLGREAAGGSQEAESRKEVAGAVEPQVLSSARYFLYPRLHFLKVLQLPQTAPLSSDQVF